MCISPYCEKKKRSRRENSVPFASRFNKKKISYRSRESYFGASTVAEFMIREFQGSSVILLKKVNANIFLHFFYPFSCFTVSMIEENTHS